MALAAELLTYTRDAAGTRGERRPRCSGVSCRKRTERLVNIKDWPYLMGYIAEALI